MNGMKLRKQSILLVFCMFGNHYFSNHLCFSRCGKKFKKQFQTEHQNTLVANQQ